MVAAQSVLSIVETDTINKLRKDLLNDGWELQVHQVGTGFGDGYCYLAYVQVIETGDCFGPITLKVNGLGRSEIDALCACISQANSLGVYRRKLSETRNALSGYTSQEDKPRRGRSMEKALTMVNRWSGLNMIKSRT